MQGKTDFLPKNFCIRAYQLNSYWIVLRNAYMRTPMETPSFQRSNVCEEVNRFVNWISKVYCLFLISSTKEHEHLAFISAKATKQNIRLHIWLVMEASLQMAGARASVFFFNNI